MQKYKFNSEEKKSFEVTIYIYYTRILLCEKRKKKIIMLKKFTI